MHVFYEEDGDFKAATILTQNDASYQVEAASGKRSKIKAANVLLKFDGGSIADFVSRADVEAQAIEPEFLWEVAPEGEFGFADLANEYFGHAATPPEAATIASRLHSAPIYFYKRGKGRYQKAPADNVKAALAGIEKKKRQQEQIAAWVTELKSGVLPPSFTTEHVDRLLFKPDKNTLEFKALEAAFTESGAGMPHLLARAGGLAGPHDYLLRKFLFDNACLTQSPVIDAASLTEPDLPPAAAEAFSIDDAETTEIDDAFSLQRLNSNSIRVGVHIAAPSLFFGVDSPLEAMARERLSTVYHPAGKITMLPDGVVSAITLAAGAPRAAVSLYLTVNTSDWTVTQTESRVERVHITTNLRHDALESYFTQATLAAGTVTGPWAEELVLLHQFAMALKARRGAADSQDRQDFTFKIDGDRVVIGKRERGTPIDTVVAELMILTNATWGEQLATRGVAAIYRNQVNGRTRMDLKPAMHEGLGVSHYAWSSSPIRRYVDLVNQRQLVAALQGKPPPFAADTNLLSAVSAFETAYEAYNDFQRGMERYWALKYLEQEQIALMDGVIIRDDLVRLHDVPLISKCVGIPGLAPGRQIQVALSKFDYFTLDFTFRYVAVKTESPA